MAELNKMYGGVANSPESYLKENLVAESNIIYVANTSILPTLPNLLVIGDGENAETVLVKSKRSDNGFNVDRAIEGTAKAWEKTTVVARNFTNYDYSQLISNIEKLNNSKLEDESKIDFEIAEDRKNLLKTDSIKIIFGKIKKYFEDLKTVAFTAKLSDLTEDSDHKTVTDAEKEAWSSKISQDDLNNLSTTLTESLNNKVDKEDGKSLSTNDFTNEYKNKIDGVINEKGQPNGYASLDGTGKVPSSQLPDLDVLPNDGTEGQVLKKTSDGVSWGDDENTTYQEATQSNAGLLSAADKKKLDGISGTELMTSTSNGVKFYKQGKVVVASIFKQINANSLRNRPSNSMNIPSDFRPTSNMQSIYFTANVLDGNSNRYMCTVSCRVNSTNIDVDSAHTISSSATLFLLGSVMYFTN